MHVRPLTNTAGALLTIFLAGKSKREVDQLWWDSQRRSVYFIDGQKLIGESTVAGSSEGTEPDKSKRYGLILAFDSIGDAERVAQAIRVRGFTERDATPAERPGDYWLPGEFDDYRGNANKVPHPKG